jgi:hypothetical protein
VALDDNVRAEKHRDGVYDHTHHRGDTYVPGAKGAKPHVRQITFPEVVLAERSRSSNTGALLGGYRPPKGTNIEFGN